jgi:hypothetical protein
LALTPANVFCYCKCFVRRKREAKQFIFHSGKKISGRAAGGSVFAGNIPAKLIGGQHVGSSVGDLDPDPNMHGSATFWQAVSGSTSERKAESGSTSKSKAGSESGDLDPHRSQKQDPNPDLDLHQGKIRRRGGGRRLKMEQ